MPVHKLST